MVQTGTKDQESLGTHPHTKQILPPARGQEDWRC
jgi:hypothetical protein